MKDIEIAAKIATKRELTVEIKAVGIGVEADIRAKEGTKSIKY